MDGWRVEQEQEGNMQGDLALLHLHLHPIPIQDGLIRAWKSSFYLPQVSIWLLSGQVSLADIILG